MIGMLRSGLVGDFQHQPCYHLNHKPYHTSTIRVTEARTSSEDEGWFHLVPSNKKLLSHLLKAIEEPILLLENLFKEVLPN